MKKKIIKISLIVSVSGILIGGGIIAYMYNMPHRDVKNTSSDYSISASNLVQEYLSNPKVADSKYLDDEGESKIFEIEGVVKDVTEDYDNQKVVLLQSDKDKAGVSCTFTKATNKEVQQIKIGQLIKIKGVIRSGATYDSDLEMYENVIIEKSSIVK